MGTSAKELEPKTSANRESSQVLHILLLGVIDL